MLRVRGGDRGAAVTPAEPHPFEYRPALDGVRAIAVVAVLLYHGGVTRARGGFLGVDIFFVVSGYLITTLLLREHAQTGTVALRAFWARRARRLLPALFLVLLFVAGYAAFAAGGGELTRIRGDALATLAYVANWRFIIAGSSYFDQFALPSPLRHAWSLAIEEQWYVLWPPVLLALLQRGRGRRRLAVVVTVLATALSVALMFALFHPGTDPSRVYYGTDTRAQSLLVGALLAFAFEAAPSGLLSSLRVLIDWVGVAGAAVLAYAIVKVPDTNEGLYRGGFLAVAIAAAALVAAAVQPRGVVRGALAWAPLRAVGRISYGLYLWHWPIYVWLNPDRTGWHGNALLAIRLGVTFAVSTVSFVLVERPVRARRWPPVQIGRVVAPAAAVLVAVAILAATAGATTSTTDAELTAIRAATRHADVHVGDVAHSPRVLLVGDSVAFTLAGNWPFRAQYYGLITGYGVRWRSNARLGCGIARGGIVVGSQRVANREDCATWVQDWPKLIKEFDPDLVVVMVGAWEVFDHIIDGHRVGLGTPVGTRYLRSELDTAVGILHARGARVDFTSVPCYHQPEGRFGASDRDDPRRVATVNRLINDVAAAHPDVDRIDIGRFLCAGGKARDNINGVLVRSDGVHFTKAGASLMWDWLGPRVAQAAHEAADVRR